ERLREREPERPEVLARLGQCRYLQGESDEARTLLSAAVVKLPNDTQTLLYLAKLDVEAGRAAEAEARLRHLLKVDPADTEAMFTLVGALKQQEGRDEEARKTLAEYDAQKEALMRANKLLQEEAIHPSKDPNGPSEVGAYLLKVGQERQGLY